MPRFAANLSMMFTEVPFLDRFARAREAGFTAVEFLFPYEHPAEEIARRLRDNGLSQVLFNAPPGDWAAGERGIAALPGVAGRGVSVSAGVATFPRDAGDATGLIEAAKAALDRARSSGAHCRRTCISSASTSAGRSLVRSCRRLPSLS